jgi:hypothetical protein
VQWSRRMDVIVVPLALLVWTLVFAAVALVLRLRRGKPSRRECALEELAARYARGEIDASEYRRRHRALSRGTGGGDSPARVIERTAGTPGVNGAHGAAEPGQERRLG